MSSRLQLRCTDWQRYHKPPQRKLDSQLLYSANQESVLLLFEIPNSQAVIRIQVVLKRLPIRIILLMHSSLASVISMSYINAHV